MSVPDKILAVYFVMMNLMSYLMMWHDKHQAVRKKKRTPENTLWILAILFGSLGIWLGMKKPLYHKAAKSGFKYGIPILFIIQLFTVVYLTVIK